MARREGRHVRAPQEPSAAVHHVAAPAGRRAPSGVRRAPHHADRAAALRGARDPGPRDGGTHHVHANRLHPRLGRRSHRAARAHHDALRDRPRRPPRDSPVLQGEARPRTRTSPSARPTSRSLRKWRRYLRRTKRSSPPLERFVASRCLPPLRHCDADIGRACSLPRLRSTPRPPVPPGVRRRGREDEIQKDGQAPRSRRRDHQARRHSGARARSRPRATTRRLW